MNNKTIKLINTKKILGHEGLTELYIENGLVKKNVLFSENLEIIDCSSCVVAPGFIDPQVNGLESCNFWEEPTFEEIDRLCLDLARSGTVAFLPTIITNSNEIVLKSIEIINSYMKTKKSPGAKILGIHIEGIFISKYGVHRKEYSNSLLTLENISPYLKENVLLFTIAPELDKTGEGIKLLQKNNILVSIGHTNGTYFDGKRAIEECGIDLATHMFNAMSGVEGFSHRGTDSTNIDLLKRKLDSDKNTDYKNDGIALAILKDSNITTMAIPDGIHLSPEVIKFLYDLKKEKFSAVSDLVSSDFFEQEKLKGSLGGGQITLDKCVKNLINWKVSDIENSLLSASKPISQKINSVLKTNYGQITFEKEANLILWNTNDNSVKGTIIGQNAFINK